MKKADLCKGYWNSQRKTGVATHVFEIISHESQQKMLASAFFSDKKEGKDISSQISLELAFTNRKANTFISIVKLHGKWVHKTVFGLLFKTKLRIH